MCPTILNIPSIVADDGNIALYLTNSDFILVQLFNITILVEGNLYSLILLFH